MHVDFTAHGATTHRFGCPFGKNAESKKTIRIVLFVISLVSISLLVKINKIVLSNCRFYRVVLNKCYSSRSMLRLELSY